MHSQMTKLNLTYDQLAKIGMKCRQKNRCETASKNASEELFGYVCVGRHFFGENHVQDESVRIHCNISRLVFEVLPT